MTSIQRLALIVLMIILVGLWRPWRIDQWFTPDQQAERLFQTGKFEAAAKLFSDPLRQGTALYRAGDFKNAERAFARDGSANGAFDRGNSLVMLGKYDDAIHSYDRALQLHPQWKEATENRALAQARRDRLANQGNPDEGTGGEEKPDSIVFDDKPKGSQGDTVQIAGGPPLSDEEL
ncbi:MAG: tetratricopeptide repeat protein, partial [Planctomycetaceae bacterium]|nr:tetratricopeptide repeat protein [Planctomycetaceae bacterium]